MKYLAGITTYNPRISRLKENIASISSQLDTVLVIDNNSSNITRIEEVVSSFDNVLLVKNSKNMGIAHSMNQIGRYAFEKSYEWFLTLDQDSVCPKNLIREFSSNIKDDIGLICPYIHNVPSFISQLNPFNKTKQIQKDELPYSEQILYAVSSGQFINTAAWKAAEGFWDFLFIDYVDQEFCFHLTKLGYRIIRINRCVLSHEPGIPTFVFGIETAKQSAMREYYWARNSRLVKWLYPIEYRNSCPCSPFFATIKRIFNVLLIREDIKNKVFSIFRGVYDAHKLKNNLKSGRIPVNN